MKEFAARRYLLIALRAIPQSFILNSPFSISLHNYRFLYILIFGVKLWKRSHLPPIWNETSA